MIYCPIHRQRVRKAAWLLLLGVWLLAACGAAGATDVAAPTAAVASPTTAVASSTTDVGPPTTAAVRLTLRSTLQPTPTASPTATVVPPAPTPAPPTRTPTATRTPPTGALVVSIDGLRPDAIPLADTPNLDRLIARGAIAWRAQTVLPSVTLPGHVSMLSGTSPEVHGVRWNSYQPERGHVTVPTLFSVAHDAGLTTAMFVGKVKLAHIAVPGTVDTYAYVASGDAQVARQAAEHLRAASPAVLFVHLPDVDTTGHQDGWLSAPQLDAVTRADAAVGVLLEALGALGRLEDTLIVVTADHGGLGTGHGGAEPESMTIPWLIAGPGIRQGYTVQREVRVYDTAVTVAWALGLPLPAEWEGRLIVEAFE